MSTVPLRTLDSAYNTGRYPGYTTTTMAAFLQSSYDINPLVTLSGGVRYQYTKNKVDDFTGYQQQQLIAEGKATSADAVPGETLRTTSGSNPSSLSTRLTSPEASPARVKSSPDTS